MARLQVVKQYFSDFINKTLIPRFASTFTGFFDGSIVFVSRLSKLWIILTLFKGSPD